VLAAARITPTVPAVNMPRHIRLTKRCTYVRGKLFARTPHHGRMERDRASGNAGESAEGVLCDWRFMALPETSRSA